MTQRNNAGVSVERQGAVRVLIMAHAPLNTIVHGIRDGLATALLEAELDPQTDGVVLIGAGGNFCGGADLDEFAQGTAMLPPSLHGHIIPFIENMAKPVVAAIEGFALGGGLELALGCHARVAHRDARVGLPETNFGLIPGAGGTVRLPRAVGAARAGRMIAGAEVITAHTLADTGLFDAVTEDDIRETAIACAERLVASKSALPRLRDRTVPPPAQSDPEAFNDAHRPSAQATRLSLASVQRAATVPFDDALKAEYADFIGLLFGDESAALRHVFQSARAAQKIDAVPSGLRPAPVASVRILGNDALAALLAGRAAKAGYHVSAADSDLTLTTAASDPADPATIRLNAFDPDARVIEVVRGDTTPHESLAAAMQVVRKLRCQPVCVRTGHGPMVERLFAAYSDQARLLAAEGVPPGTIDRALETFGMRAGPFAMMDVIGARKVPEQDDTHRGRGAYLAGSAAATDPRASLSGEDATALRCVLAMVNEGARLLAEGTAQRASDIDIAAVEALGFPATRGGPMFWAETRGWPLTQMQISRLASETDDPFWTPAGMLADAAQ